MTTDAFTTAARTEGVDRYSSPGVAQYASVARFSAGALWARDYLAAEEVTDAEVEAAARAINTEGWTCDGGTHEPGNYDECTDCQHVAQGIARAALTAAREARA